MMDDVRRGRLIVAVYSVIHLTVMAVLFVLSIQHGRPWERVLVRALTQTALIHSLWKGSRWAQWLHVLGFAVTAFLFVRFGLRHPRPIVWTICLPMVTMLVSLAWGFGFSRSVRTFLAFQRGELLHLKSSASAERTPVSPEFDNERFDREDPLNPLLDACRNCGAVMKHFVVVCPQCATRRAGI